MSEETGNIVKDQSDTAGKDDYGKEDFAKEDYGKDDYGKDFGKDVAEGGFGGAAAGGPAAGGSGYNEGDITLNVGRGGDATGGDAFGGDGGDAVIYEEHTYKVFEGPEGTREYQESYRYQEGDDYSAKSGDADSEQDLGSW